MVLPREVGKMLTSRGEHHTVDLRRGALACERDLLVDLRQPRPEAADRPLDSGVAADDGALATEVPGVLVPVLDVDERQIRPVADEQLDGPAVQRRGVAATSACGLADERGLGAFFEDNERVVE